MVKFIMTQSYQDLKTLAIESLTGINYSLMPQTSSLFLHHKVIAACPKIKAYLKYRESWALIEKQTTVSNGWAILSMDFTNPELIRNLKLAVENSHLYPASEELLKIITPNFPDFIRSLQAKEAARVAKEAEEQRILALKLKEERKLKKANQETLTVQLSPLLDFKNTKKDALEKASSSLINESLIRYASGSNHNGVFLEAYFENVIISNPEKFGLGKWILMSRQHSLKVHGRIDLVYRNRLGTKLRVVELELGAISKDHFSKSRIYRRQLSKDLNFPIENIDIHLIGNSCPETIQEECDDLGMLVSTMARKEMYELCNELEGTNKAFIYKEEEAEKEIDYSLSDFFEEERAKKAEYSKKPQSYGEIMNGRDYPSYLKRQAILGKNRN